MKNSEKVLEPVSHDNRIPGEAQSQETTPPRIHSLPLDKIDDFPDHPYAVREDEDMDALVESIRERGIITPITVRPKEDGRYEIVSGHRRRKACEIVGLDSINAEIRDLTRDEAIVLMVDSNVQRSNILPSEKAKAYKMKLEAMKRQVGRPAKNNSVPLGQNFGQTARELVAADSGESNTQIQRYIRLNELAPELLDMVDKGRIAMRPAVELSYLPMEAQQMLVATIESEDATPSYAQSQTMRKLSQANELDMDGIFQILATPKGNQKERVSIRFERLRPFVPPDYTPRDTENFILKAVEYYHRYLQRQKRRDMER